MGNYKLLWSLFVHLSLCVTNHTCLELPSSNDTTVSHSAVEKTLEIISNDSIVSRNFTNFSELTTENRQVTTVNDASKTLKFQQITNASIKVGRDVTAHRPETDNASLIDISAASVTNSVSGLSTSTVVGKLADVESCRHKCGQKQSVPCSCDLKCLVYKNCCEDMLTECPEVVEETRIRYGYLLNVKVECTTHHVFLITECGTSQPLEDIRTNLSASLTNSNYLTKSTSFRGQELFSPNNASSVRETLSTHAAHSMRGSLRFSDSRIQAFIKVMYDAYVTDAATGFTYKNMDIFLCNARENSFPAIWSTVYDEALKLTNFTTLGTFAQYITGNSSIPPNIETLKTPRAECELGVITSCTNPSNLTDGNLAEKCKEFVSYASVPNMPSGPIYGNKYCALCILGPDSKYAQYITAYTKIPLETRLESAGFTGTLSEQSVTIDTFGETIYPWKTVTCRLPDTNPTEPITGDIPCVTDKCNDYGVLRPGGVCKFSYFTTMAVADDTFPLTRNEYEMFPKFARCFLELHNNVDLDGDFTPTVALFEQRRNMVIYATYFFYYEIGSMLSYSRPQLDIIHQVMLMAKVFKVYRAHTPRTRHTFDIKNSIFSLSTFNEKEGYFTNTYYAATNPNNVTACFCTEFNPYTPRLTRLPCVISCVQDDVDVQAVSGYLQSPCFSVFNVSTGRAKNGEFNVASTFVLVSISTFFQLKVNILLMT